MANRTTVGSGADDDDKVREVEEKAAPEGADSQGTENADELDNTVVPLNDSPVNYDVDEINEFLGAVFHVKHGETLVQISGKAPKGFGVPWTHKFIQRFAKRTEGMRAYFSTSSLTPIEGQMRHTKQAFVAYHVLVLDDVGTKIPEADIPEDLAENYRIESSPGNFQLGYILAEPITDYEEAQLLIDLFVDAGLTDGGGAMPVKKVRLPCGVNGKEGDNKMFPVKLHYMEGEPWDVQELLDAAGIKVDWEKQRLLARDRTRKAKRYTAAATPWVPDLFYVDPLTGVFDPVLEYLYTQGMVIQDAQEPFMDIICPWADEHTDQDLQGRLAGYSPLGHGMYPHARKWHCFHGHCKDRTQADFLQEINAMGGPLMPEREFAPEAVMSMVYDKANDKVYDLKEKGPLNAMAVVSVNRITPKVAMPNGTMVEQLPLWLKQPSAVTVAGAVNDPSKRERLIEDVHGQRKVNLFHMPEYAPADPDPTHVGIFTGYLDYLLPNEDEREYFMDWLACKVQHPEFRGVAMVLITNAQGTGKNTLMEIISNLFGQHNTMQVPMDRLLDGNNQFNEFQSKLFVNADESLAVTDPAVARRAYNKLKELVDTSAREVTINPKMQSKYTAVCATSYMFFSNHDDAIYLQEGDRRFYVMRGPHIPAPPDYFASIYNWMKGSDWQQHIWNYLLAREVDLPAMQAKPKVTQAMEDMMQETKSPLNAVIEAAIAVWPSAMVPPKVIMDILPSYTPRGVPEKYHHAAKRLISDRTSSLRALRGQDGFDDRIRTPGARVVHVLRRQDIAKVGAIDVMLAERDKAKTALDDYDENKFKQAIDTWLEDEGFDF